MDAATRKAFDATRNFSDKSFSYRGSPMPGSAETLFLEEGERQVANTKVARWDLVKGSRVDTIKLPERAEFVLCRPDGKSFLTFSQVERKIRIWDVKSGKEITKPISVPDQALSKYAEVFSQNGA